jgi:hypothetical protein
MMRKHTLVLCTIGFVLTGCFTDAATRLAADLEGGAKRVGNAEHDRFVVEHRTPSKSDECVGSYKVQLDKVGAIIIWCNDESGANVVSSHSTSSHSRSVDTLQTWILVKDAGEPLIVGLERRGGRVVIVDVT